LFGACLPDHGNFVKNSLRLVKFLFFFEYDFGLKKPGQSHEKSTNSIRFTGGYVSAMACYLPPTIYNQVSVMISRDCHAQETDIVQSSRPLSTEA